MSSNVSFETKMKNRLFFYEHTNQAGRMTGRNVSVIREEIRKSLALADENKCLKKHFPLKSNSKLKIFIKRVIRKMTFLVFGWLIDPVFRQQNDFNENLLNAAVKTAEAAWITEDRYAQQIEEMDLRYSEKIRALEEMISKQEKEIEFLKTGRS